MVRVIFYAERQGFSPVGEWLSEQHRRRRDIWIKARGRMQLLADYGHELGRPAVGYLRDGIYELRFRCGNAQFRILYFFFGREAVVLAHAFGKPGGPVDQEEIERAIKRKENFLSAPKEHSYEEE